MQFAWYLCKAFWPWIPSLHRARSILEPASVLRRGFSAAFRVICSKLSGVSFWIYFRLVRVYLGDQRMRRVKDHDEEGKGPGDQEEPGDQGTRGPRDQSTRGPEDQGTKGSGEPEIGFPVYIYIYLFILIYIYKFIFVPRVLDFFPGNLDFFPVIPQTAPNSWFTTKNHNNNSLPRGLQSPQLTFWSHLFIWVATARATPRPCLKNWLLRTCSENPPNQT